MQTLPSELQPRRASAWAPTSLIVLVAVLAVGSITSQAFASTTHCPGSFYSHSSGGPSYKVTNLTVTNTTCVAGKRLSGKIPVYRVLRPLNVEGFRCTATMHYTNPQFPSGGGHQMYLCRKRSKAVTWNLEIPSEL
jgi:hypothetical protein